MGRRVFIAAIAAFALLVLGPSLIFHAREAIEPTVTLFAVGDILPTRDVARQMEKRGNDYPFRETREASRAADIAFGNLETPITPGPEVKDGATIFRADLEAATALSDAGFDVVSLANNHALDYGTEGLRDTFLALDGNAIAHAGAGDDRTDAHEASVIRRNDVAVAFLAYVDPRLVAKSSAAGKKPGLAIMDIAAMKKDVAAAKKKADFVIVSMHAGTEYAAFPDGVQLDFAQAAIDAGAEMVLGHHPHVIQNAERYKGKYIFYSLGNFVFDKSEHEETKDGLAIRATFGKSGVKNLELLPVRIEGGQPRFLEGPEKDKALQRLGPEFLEVVRMP